MYIQYCKYVEIIQKIDNLDEDLTKTCEDLTVKVILKAVFNNEGLTNDTIKALIRLAENQKIRYLTGRQLGRVI